jgi:cytochrome P450
LTTQFVPDSAAPQPGLAGSVNNHAVGPTGPLKPVPCVRRRDGIGGTLAFRRDPLSFLRGGLDKHGDIFKFRVLGVPLTLINHPDAVRHVLVENSENYDKNNLLYNIARVGLRTGLIANPGGEHWRRQRKLMNPSFLPRSVAHFARIMVDESNAVVDDWERTQRAGTPIDVGTELGELVLRIVMKSVFSVESGSTVDLQRIFHELNTRFANYLKFPFPPLFVPMPRHARIRKLIRDADDRVFGLIRERLDGGTASGGAVDTTEPDLLSLLMAATYEESGGHMTIEHLQHEVGNILTGAFDTTTNTVAWLFYLLARHPVAQQRLFDEVDAVCAGRLPSYDDLPKLKFLRMAIDETMRMYPPGYQIMRRAIQDDVLLDHHVPANSNVLVNTYLLHRHAAFWSHPESFDPDRFSPEETAKRPKHVYAPFGAGPRICIGKYFALTELCLIIATISQRFRLELQPGAPAVEVEPLITLNARGGIHLRLEARQR